jgi:hypothetical protein
MTHTMMSPFAMFFRRRLADGVRGEGIGGVWLPAGGGSSECDDDANELLEDDDDPSLLVS